MVTSSYSIRTETPHETDVYVYDSGQSGPTTMVVGGIHGNEPSGYRAATQIASWGVDRGKMVVLPRANEVAIGRNSRYDDDGDLNRKFPPLSGDPETPLAQAIWKQVVKHDPDWMFDLHSARGIYKSGDGSVGQALFPTWTSPAREYGENTVADLNTEFGFTGDMRYLMGNTLDADRPMLMHRAAGMRDIPGYICETTRKDTTTSEQINWHLFCVEHVMNQYGQQRIPPQSSVDYSAGMVRLDEYWQEFDVSGYYSHPAVVAPALSYNGRNPAHVRITGLTGSSFEARVEEWPYLDDVHVEEQAGYLILNPGTYSTTNGRRIEVGRSQVNHEWESVSFENSFSTTPILFAMPQTTTGSDPIVARIQNASPSGFQYRVQEQDAGRATEYHYEEVVSWIAFEPGRGSLGSRDYEANTTIANDSWHNIQFSRSYQNPTFIADVMSYNGKDSATIRWKNLTSSGVDIFIEEEQSENKEKRHRDETVSYFIAEG